MGCSLSNLVMDKGLVSLPNIVSSVIVGFSFRFSIPPIVMVTVDCDFFDQAYVTNVTTSQCTISFSTSLAVPCTVRYVALGYIPSILPVPSVTLSSSTTYFLPAINSSNIIFDYGNVQFSPTSISTGTQTFNFSFASNPIVLLGTDCSSAGVGAASVNITPTQFQFFLSQPMASPCNLRYLAIGQSVGSTVSPNSGSINTITPNFGISTWFPLSVTTPNTVLDCGVFYSIANNGIISFNITFSSSPIVFVQCSTQWVSSNNVTNTQFSYFYSVSESTSPTVITYIAIGTVS
jgi:hypothetical protein